MALHLVQRRPHRVLGKAILVRASIIMAMDDTTIKEVVAIIGIATTSSKITSKLLGACLINLLHHYGTGTQGSLLRN